MNTSKTALACALLLAGCSPRAPQESLDDSALLREVGESFHRHEIEKWLFLQLKYGDEVERLPELSETAARESGELAGRLLARLGEVRPDRLSREERIALGGLRWDLSMSVEEAEYYWLQFPVTPRQLRSLSIRPLFEDFVFDDADDAGRYLRLVAQLPVWIDALRSKLAGQAQRGIRLPVAGIDLSLPVWQAFDRFLVVTPERLAALSDDEAAALRGELEATLAEEVRPALERLIGYLDGEYRDAAPTAVGLSQYPGGTEYYRHRIRFTTTLDMDPEEIHRIGLRRVAEVHEEMSEVRRSLGFEGSREDFHHALETDPRFFAETPEQVEQVLRSYVEKIEPRIDEYFRRRPRTPYEIRRLDPSLEGSMTYGFYWWPTPEHPVGTYYYNGSKLDERSLLGAESLIYHELVPGHHFQVSLQDENDTIPPYRHESLYMAFGEGWANYAALLGCEMGLYEDPYSLYGRLAGEAKFAVRLVVDTGMNHLGWTREEASRYMRENTLESNAQIASETLRYTVDAPAQALAYELGTLKFLELRRRAEEALGDRFDIRELHAAFLEHGNMPLAVLEEHVDDFIEQSRYRPLGGNEGGKH